MRKILLTLLTTLLCSVTVRGTVIASLSFDSPASMPANYTLSSSNSPIIATTNDRSCILVGNSGTPSAPDTWSATDAAAPSGGKRWIAFKPDEDCSVTITVLATSTGRVFYLYDKDHHSTSDFVSSKACDAKDTWYTWDVELKGGTWYAISANKSDTYVNAMSFEAATSCSTPTQTFSDGAYTVGGSDLDLSSLFTSNSSGAVTYSVQNDDDDTGAEIDGTSFSATSAGTVTVRASQAADGDYCAKTIDADITVSAGCSPAISVSPASANYCKDDVATALSFTGSGHNAQKWQKSTDSGSSWNDIAGATNATYTPSTSATGSTQYRVVTTCDSYTTTATSSAATVTVKTSPGLNISLAP